MNGPDSSERPNADCFSEGDILQPTDVADLDVAWNNAWATVPPVASLLRARFVDRRVRFDTLPNAKRYATSDPERAEVLRRYRAVLESLIGDVLTDSQSLVVVTCSWSPTPFPVERASGVSAVVPEAVYWRSHDLATGRGFHSWQHHYVSRLAAEDPELERLLIFVANDLTDGVIVTNDACAWVFHPYDGGAEVFTSSVEGRDLLSSAHADWLPSVS